MNPSSQGWLDHLDSTSQRSFQDSKADQLQRSEIIGPPMFRNNETIGMNYWVLINPRHGSVQHPQPLSQRKIMLVY
jgi:hypothetical protein